MTTESKLNLQQVVDVWFLRFGYAWVTNSDVQDETWKAVVNTLMRSNKLEYHLIHDKTGIQEVYRLKESHANS